MRFMFFSPAPARFRAVPALLKTLACLSVATPMFCTSAQATQIVYTSDSSAGAGLYLHDTVTSARRTLTSPIGADRSIDHFLVSPKNTGVAYIADALEENFNQLYYVDMKKGVNKQVNPIVPNNRSFYDFAFDGTGKNLFYLADMDTFDLFEIYRTDTKKFATTKINPVLQPFAQIESFEPLPKGNGVVVNGDLATDDREELFLMTGVNAPLLPLSSGINSNGEVDDFKVTPKGTGVVFIGDMDQSGVNELYYTDLKKRTTVKLSSPLPLGSSVKSFIIDPKGKSVIYAADQDINGKIELYKVDIKKGTVVTVSGDMENDRDVQNYGYSVDLKGANLLFIANSENASQNEVFRTNLKTGVVEKMSGPLTIGSNYGAAFDGVGNVYYIGDQNGPNFMDLFKRESSTGNMVRVDDPGVSSAHVYGAGIEIKGAGVLYFTLNMSTFQFGYIYFDAKTGSRTPLQQPGEAIMQFEVLNGNEIFLAA